MSQTTTNAQIISNAERAALDLISRDISPVPVPIGEKNPNRKKWQLLRITAAEVPTYFSGNVNVGAIMGPASGNLTDADLDCREAIALAPFFLPETHSIYGRPSKQQSHRLFTCADVPDKASIKLVDETKACILELRMGGGGKGAQSVMPGSVHPSGERYQWDEDGERAEVGFAALKAGAMKIAIGTMLIRHWPARGTRNETAMTVGGFLARAGWTADEIAHFVTTICRVHGEADDPEAHGQAARSSAERHAQGGQVFGMPQMIEIFGEPVMKKIGKELDYVGEIVQRVAGALNWRERKANGFPVPSVHNAILAINSIGVECSHDTFHSTLLIGFKGDDFRHQLSAVEGEVSDYAILRLRRIISDRFGIDFLDTSTRDAVATLALEHCFDPVCDMLDEAERNYDGTERLDRMAVDYFNCADTPLNRAFVRKTMIAAVRRARRPGCKFDNITVLESEEGWNKSGAWWVLAGDENFSDQSILNVREKEVQELLATIWIHESADLAGMRKAEVESVKAFASRRKDIARPAFGHFVKKQPRHAINVGTTNSDEYLQSQTGNRRFWPLKVLQSIDLEKLKNDRLQLWGEAAKYESAGESITLPKELWAAAGEAQEQRRAKDPWEDLVRNLPDSVGSDYNGDARRILHFDRDRELVSSSDILTFVLHVPVGHQKTADTMRLATVMKRAGWERPKDGRASINGKQVRAFCRKRLL